MSTAGATSPTLVRVGRRPVHDRHVRVVAYELHSDPAPRGVAAAGHDVHADLFLTGMVDVGLDRLASGHDVVVALPAALIHDGALDEAIDGLPVATGTTPCCPASTPG